VDGTESSSFNRLMTFLKAKRKFFFVSLVVPTQSILVSLNMQYRLPPSCSIAGVSDVWRDIGVDDCSMLLSNNRVVSLSAIVVDCCFSRGVFLTRNTNFFFFLGWSGGCACTGATVDAGVGVGTGCGVSRFVFHFANPVDFAMLNDEPNFSIATFITNRWCSVKELRYSSTSSCCAVITMETDDEPSNRLFLGLLLLRLLLLRLLL